MILSIFKNLYFQVIFSNCDMNENDFYLKRKVTLYLVSYKISHWLVKFFLWSGYKILNDNKSNGVLYFKEVLYVFI